MKISFFPSRIAINNHLIIKVLIACLLLGNYSIAHAQKQFRVGLLFDFMSEELSPMMKQFETEVRAVVGNDAKLVFDRNNAKINFFDPEKAQQQYLEMTRSNVDVILAFGPTNSALIAKQKNFKKPTILFGAVNSDLLDINDKTKSSGIKNFTYIVTPISYQRDLKDFKQIYPFKRVAVMGAHGPWQSKQTLASLDKTFAELNADYKLVPYKSIEDLKQQLDDVDAVYLAEGFGIPNQEIADMAELFIQKSLPSFSSGHIDNVINGWLATNQSNSNFERLFRRLSLSVEAVVNGRNLADLPVFLDLSNNTTINYNTAYKLGIPIRFSQISKLNLVGDFDDFIVEELYTIDEAVEVALKQNLELQASKIDIELAEHNLSQSKTSYFPDLSASAVKQYNDPDLARISGGQNPEQTLTGSLALAQTLYSEDASAAITIQRNQLEAQKQTYRSAELDTVLSTTRASFDLLRLKNALQSQVENLNITKRNLRVAQQKFDAGQSGKGDIYRFRSEMANNMQNLISAINAYSQGQYALNKVLNNPINTQVGIDTEDITGKVLTQKDYGYDHIRKTLDDPSKQLAFEDFLLQEALTNSPELKSLNFNLKAVERDMKQYGWRRYIPTVSANAQYNNVLDRSGEGLPDPNFALDDNYSVGLVFSVPLFNRNQDNVSLKRAKAQHQKLQLNIQQLKQQIESQLRNAVLQVSNSIASIELSKVSEQSAKQSLELIETSYAKGAVTITDLIDAQNNYLQAQLASSNALFNFLDSGIGLERAISEYYYFDKDTVRSSSTMQRFEEYRKTHKNRFFREINNEN